MRRPTTLAARTATERSSGGDLDQLGVAAAVQVRAKIRRACPFAAWLPRFLADDEAANIRSVGFLMDF